MIKPSYRTRNRIVQKQFKLLFYNAAKQQIPATNYYNPNQSRSWRRGRSIPAISEARRNEFSTILEGVRWTFSKIILFRAIQMFQEMMEQTKSISSPTRFALNERRNPPSNITQIPSLRPAIFQTSSEKEHLNDTLPGSYEKRRIF